MGLSWNPLKWGLGAIALITLTSLFVATNPQPEDYLNYASQRLNTEIQNKICQSPNLPNTLTNWLQETGLQDQVTQWNSQFQDLCQQTLTQGGNQFERPVQQFLAQSTQQQNFGLFSIYTTQIATQEFRTIAICGYFITLP